MKAPLSALLSLVGLVSFGTTLKAQDRVVSGTVVDAGSGQPLQAVEVSGGGARSISDGAGRFVLNGVTGSSSVALQVHLIGYRPISDTVLVGDRNVHLALSGAAVALDAIVVTGTAGEVQQRSLGNAIGMISAPKLMETAPVLDVQQVLTARIPGLAVLPTQGNVGTGGLTQLRGISSLTLSNEPLLYVDGIRVDNNSRAGPNIREGRQVARINDFDPEDIESVEVIRGPSAATLYGTEASRGVIQILTHQGRDGPPRWSLTMKEGSNWFMNPEGRIPLLYGRDPVTGAIDSVNLYQEEESRPGGRPVFQNGAVHSYALSVSGGVPSMHYYLSGIWGDNNGIVSYNWRHELSTHANMSLVPSTHFSIKTSLGVVRNTARLAQAYDLYGVLDQILATTPAQYLHLDLPTRGFFRAPPEVIATIDSRSSIERTISSVQFRHQPTTWLTHHLTAGMDLGDETSTTLFPAARAGTESSCLLGAHCVGDRDDARRLVRYSTLDYGINADFGLTSRVRTTTSFGAQYYAKDIVLSDVNCFGFADPNLSVCNGAAQTTGSDDRIQNKTVGVFGQQVLGFNNRLFLTVATRVDNNSAFGKNFRLVAYPKFSASWVLNEEPFWRGLPSPLSWLNTLKVRAALGAAGQQPDALAAVPAYQSVAGTLTAYNIGNPDLKPERAQELEAGFDAGLWNDRVGLQYTHFEKQTNDAIVARQLAPSGGFPAKQFINSGSVRNHGDEWSLDARVVEGRTFAWDFGVSFARNASQVVSLDGLPTITVTGNQVDSVGFPVAAYFARRIVSASLDANHKPVNVLCDAGPGNAPIACAQAPRVYIGQPTPSWLGAVRTGFTFFRDLKLSALVDFKGGHLVGMGFALGMYHVRALVDSSDAVFLANQALTATVPNLLPATVIKGAFAKLREIALTYRVPASWVRGLGASRPTLSVAGRNLATLWQAEKYRNGMQVLDPEVHTGDIGSEQSLGNTVPFPQLASVLVTLRLTF